MLVLNRKENESIVVVLSQETLRHVADTHPQGIQVVFTITEVKGNRVGVGVDAPPIVPVFREELLNTPEVAPHG